MVKAHRLYPWMTPKVARLIALKHSLADDRLSRIVAPACTRAIQKAYAEYVKRTRERMCGETQKQPKKWWKETQALLGNTTSNLGCTL